MPVESSEESPAENDKPVGRTAPHGTSVESPRRRAEPDLPVSSMGPDDRFLLAGVAGGDRAALRALMNRYDRLVRYTVFRADKSHCLKDPQWLDSVASEAWTGFIQSIRCSDNYPQSVSAYLARIAYNQAISARRRADRVDDHPMGESDADTADVAAAVDDPTVTLSQLEQLEALRDCLTKLDADSRRLATQLEAITERRWRDAAAALKMKESTLRSKWKQVLHRLRRCLEHKTGESFARPGSASDSLHEGGTSAGEGSRS